MKLFKNLIKIALIISGVTAPLYGYALEDNKVYFASGVDGEDSGEHSFKEYEHSVTDDQWGGVTGGEMNQTGGDFEHRVKFYGFNIRANRENSTNVGNWVKDTPRIFEDSMYTKYKYAVNRYGDDHSTWWSYYNEANFAVFGELTLVLPDQNKKLHKYYCDNVMLVQFGNTDARNTWSVFTNYNTDKVPYTRDGVTRSEVFATTNAGSSTNTYLICSKVNRTKPYLEKYLVSISNTKDDKWVDDEASIFYAKEFKKLL
jgi:hypothetical protein